MWFEFNLIQFEFNQFVLNWVKFKPIQPISLGTITMWNPKKKNIMFIWIDFNLEIWIESKLNVIWNQFNSIWISFNIFEFNIIFIIISIQIQLS
jgi:hypothetical protein